jgi:hypothetical protein
VRTALALALLGAAPCRGGGGDDHPAAGGLERSIERGLGAQLGVAIAGVTCAGARCTATLEGGGALPVAVRGKDWELDGLVVAAAPLEQYLGAALADLGITAKIDCGARVRAVAVGDRIECRLGDAGRAWATIRAGGDFAIELAIGADAVAARAAAADDDALERQSVALDHDPDGGAGEGEGEGEPDDAPQDAGVDAAGAP